MELGSYFRFRSDPRIPSLEPPERKGWPRRSKSGGVQLRMENLTGLSRSDPNFESAVKDVLANEPEEKVNSTLYLLDLKKADPQNRVPASSPASHSVKDD